MKRLALTKDGKMTYCTASEENIGKGRCIASKSFNFKSDGDTFYELNRILGEEAEQFIHEELDEDACYTSVDHQEDLDKLEDYTQEKNNLSIKE